MSSVDGVARTSKRHDDNGDDDSTSAERQSAGQRVQRNGQCRRWTMERELNNGENDLGKSTFDICY